MTESIQILKSQKREGRGTAFSKKLRSDGFLPAVVYGIFKDVENVHVNMRDFERLYRSVGESTIINLSVGDGDLSPVLIHDVQRDPVTRLPLHVDFLRIDMNKTLKTSVPFEFVGESSAVKEHGALVIHTLDLLEIECLPINLPKSISVDISSLTEVGASLCVSDIPLPQGVSAITDGETVVVQTELPKEEEVEEEAPADAEAKAVEEAAGEESKESKAGEDGKSESRGGKKEDEQKA